MILNLTLFILALFILVKAAQYSNIFSTRIARSLHISEFLISFFVVAIVSIFPESTIAIIAAREGVPELGLGTLFGSNVVDLTLVLGIVILFSKSGLKINSEIIKRDFVYLLLLLLPILLGLDAHFSRIDGTILIAACALFLFTLYKDSYRFSKHTNTSNNFLKNFILLIISLAFLLGSAHYTVEYGAKFASDIKFPPVLVGLIMISLGVCLPELTFSLKAVKSNHSTLALGDLLGTVIMDATLVVGIIAIIRPFSFDPILIYPAGISMIIAGALAIFFIRTGKTLTKKEALILIFCYILYLVTELTINRII